jgi:sugar phosphate isomerase/epimerase
VVFCGFEGESYETVPIVRQTIGLVPKATRAARLKETLAISDFAKALGVDTIGMHLGAVPEDPNDPEYPAIVEAVRQVCDHCKRNGQRFHLETGQETADALLRFIEAVGRDNLGINFDPANMILYNAGEPIAALKKLGNYVKSVHCKDAKTTRRPDQKWYEDCPLGAGDVGMETFIRTLKGLGYEGPLTIEREYSADQAGDIREAVQLLERLRKM